MYTEMNNLYLKRITFTPTNNTSLPYNELYFDNTGDTYECLAHKGVEAEEYLRLFRHKLYRKTVTFTRVDPSQVKIVPRLLYWNKVRTEPDENQYFYLRREPEGVTDGNNIDRFIVGLYTQTDDGEYQFLENSVEHGDTYLMYETIEEPEDPYCLF